LRFSPKLPTNRLRIRLGPPTLGSGIDIRSLKPKHVQTFPRELRVETSFGRLNLGVNDRVVLIQNEVTCDDQSKSPPLEVTATDLLRPREISLGP